MREPTGWRFYAFQFAAYALIGAALATLLGWWVVPFGVGIGILEATR